MFKAPDKLLQAHDKGDLQFQIRSNQYPSKPIPKLPPNLNQNSLQTQIWQLKISPGVGVKTGFCLAELVPPNLVDFSQLFMSGF
jgi:hypothetical protein